jgi:hypothetical protein
VVSWPAEALFVASRCRRIIFCSSTPGVRPSVERGGQGSLCARSSLVSSRYLGAVLRAPRPSSCRARTYHRCPLPTAAAGIAAPQLLYSSHGRSFLSRPRVHLRARRVAASPLIFSPRYYHPIPRPCTPICLFPSLFHHRSVFVGCKLATPSSLTTPWCCHTAHGPRRLFRPLL